MDSDDPATTGAGNDEAANDRAGDLTTLTNLAGAFSSNGEPLATISTVATSWKYTTEDGTRTLATGDLVLLADGYAHGGDGGVVYRYKGGAASVNLSIEDYEIPATWEKIVVLPKVSILSAGKEWVVVAADGATYVLSKDAAGTIKVSQSTINVVAAAASVAVGVGVVGLAVSGAGAVALNVVLSKTNAFIDTSAVTATSGDVTLNATGNAAITATVVAASLAVGAGLVGVAASIGVAISKNLIGWRLDGSSDPAEVRAYTRNSSISAGGNLRLTATSGAKISALVFAGSVAVGVGLGALGLAGSGVFVENRIQVLVQSAIDGDGVLGISAASITLDASDASTVTAFAGAVALAAAFGGLAASLSIGVSLARNEIANVVEASISSASDVVARVGAITLDAREVATVNAVTAAAALAVAGGAFAGIALSGAGADATNAIYTKTRAFLLNSTVRAATDVFVHANGSATINALVLAFSAAVGLGFVGIGASIGVSLARNLIGWNPAAYDATSEEVLDGLEADTLVLVATGSLRGNIYKYVGTDQTGPVDLSDQDYTSPDWELQNGADYSSDQVLPVATSLLNGDTVRIANGAGAGDVFEYIGTTVTGTVDDPIDLKNQDYRNTSLWRQLNLTSTPAEVTATSTDTSIVAGGGVSIVALSTNTINAIVATLSAAISGGAVGIGLSGAGASATNLIKANVTAKIDGDDSGINASSILVAADDSSSIAAFTGSASLAASVGALGGSVSIAVALALNEISSGVSASIEGAGGVTTVPEFTDTDTSVAVKVGDRVRHGSTTYRYVGADATLDLTIAAQYSDTTLWLPVSTSVFASSLTSAAVQPGQRVTVGSRVYEYLGPASTLNLTTETYSDQTRWRLAALVGDVTVTATNAATITSTTLAASAAVGAAFLANLSLAGAGGSAVNVILGTTKAFVNGSVLSSAGDVNVRAGDAATITATVLTVAAGISIGLVAGAISIGVAEAKNLIGQKVDSTPQAAEVWAYISSSSVAAGGSVAVSATEGATINASIASAAGAGALGLIAIAVAVAGVTITNVVRTDVRAYVKDTTGNGIAAHDDIEINASDTSTISALASAVSYSAAIGLGAAVSVAISKATNTITTLVEASATSAKIATTTGDLAITATEIATITTAATAASRATVALVSGCGERGRGDVDDHDDDQGVRRPGRAGHGDDVTIDAIATGTATTTAFGNANATGLIAISGAVTRATSNREPHGREPARRLRGHAEGARPRRHLGRLDTRGDRRRHCDGRLGRDRSGRRGGRDEGHRVDHPERRGYADGQGHDHRRARPVDRRRHQRRRPTTTTTTPARSSTAPGRPPRRSRPRAA